MLLIWIMASTMGGIETQSGSDCNERAATMTTISKVARDFLRHYGVNDPESRTESKECLFNVMLIERVDECQRFRHMEERHVSPAFLVKRAGSEHALELDFS